MEQKGSMLLKVVSIIMMIGGIISAVVSVIMAIVAAAGSVLLSQPETQTALNDALEQNNIDKSATGAVMGLLWVGVIILVAGSVLEIIAGVKGKNNWNNPPQAQSLMILGIVCAVISVIGNILFAASGAGMQIVSILAGLVLPILYIIGTVQLKNQA